MLAWTLEHTAPATDARAVLARIGAVLRAALAEAEAVAGPGVDTLDRLATVAGAASQELQGAVRDLGPEEVPVKGLFYALGDPPRVELREGDLLTLRRDVGNEHDPRAIGIHAGCGTRIGYVPRWTAADLAPQLDAGLPARAWLASGCGTRWDARLDGPAVLAMRVARQAAREAESFDDIPF